MTASELVRSSKSNGVVRRLQSWFLVEPRNKATYGFPVMMIGFVVAATALGPRLNPDTQSYLNNSVVRSPLYPFVLDAFGSTLSLLVFFQILLGVFAVCYFVYTLQRLFDWPKVLSYVAVAVLLVPFFSPKMLVGNQVLTESICYSLLLLSASFFLDGLVKNELRRIFLSLVWLTLLMLTRTQFVFVYPTMALMLLMARRRVRFWSALGAVFLSFATAGLLERTYHAAFHGAFVRTPYTGVQLAAGPLYRSLSIDARLFEGVQRGVFESARTLMDQQVVSFEACNDLQPPVHCGYYHYAPSYNTIVWKSLYPALESHGVTDWHQIEQLTKSMAFKLILVRPVAYLKHYLTAMFHGVGEYLLCLLFLAGAWASARAWRDGNELATFLAFVTVLNLTNIALIAFVEPLLGRYMFYTSYPQVVAFLATFHRGVKS